MQITEKSNLTFGDTQISLIHSVGSLYTKTSLIHSAS